MAKKLFTVCIVFILGLAGCSGGGSSTAVKTSSSGGGRPAWIEKGETRSQDKTMFWLAVGSGDSPQEAAQSARQEVAAQIKTHVRARITDVTRASGGEVKERFESLSRSITDARLEGLEILQQYTGRRRSYALAGLNKSVYLGKIEDQVREKYNNAKSNFTQASLKRKTGDFLQYITLAGNALSVLEECKNPEYFYRSFIQGGSSAGTLAFTLENSVTAGINDFISSIELKTENTPQKGTAGKALKKDLSVTFTSGGKPIADFPVKFTTDKGRVSMEPARVSGKDGSAVCKVTYIEKSPVQTIRILCRLDLSSLPEGRFNTDGKQAEFSINLDSASKWVVFIHETGANGIVLSGVLSKMRDGGVDVRQLNLQGDFDEGAFIAQASGKLAAYNLLVGKFTVREIDRAMGSVTCRADGHIKAVELSTKRVVFRKAIENVIGVSYTGDVSEGNRSALSNAAKKAAEIVKKELGF